jgi:endonuclease-3 related protein
MREMINGIYERLLNHYDHFDWWAPENPDEIIIGAILVQNTNWKNVEKALANLKAAKLTRIRDIFEADAELIAECIRPSGYYNLKTERLMAVADNLVEFNYTKFTVPEIRDYLLDIKGIGDETADTIILYAYQLPTFVVDSYTIRVMSRVGIVSEKIKYMELKKLIEDNIEESVTIYNEFHAFFVSVAKDFCTKEPKCSSCPLKDICKTGLEV